MVMNYDWEWKRLSEGRPAGRVILGNDELQLVAEGEWIAGQWSVDWQPTHWQAKPLPPQPHKPHTFFISDGHGGTLTSDKDLAARSRTASAR
jgi:hypothetical protein